MNERARNIAYITVIIAIAYTAPGIAAAQPAEETVAETPAAVPVPALMPDVVPESTAMVTIPKEEYESLQQAVEALQRENQRFITRRNQLLAENERQAAEIGLWRARLEHVLQCSSIAEAIEELKVLLTAGTAGVSQGVKQDGSNQEKK